MGEIKQTRISDHPVPVPVMITNFHDVPTCLISPLIPWQVYLATLPRGATFGQLCTYVHTLCHDPGTVATKDQDIIEKLVGAALHLATGEFHP